jgi:hypothetical protein
MGRQHGELLRAAGGADDILDHYVDMPERLLAPGGGAAALARPIIAGLKELGLSALDRSRPADLRARSRAALSALGRPANFGRYLGVMDLFQNVIGTAGRLAVGPFRRAARIAELAAAVPACSSVVTWGAASKDGVLRHARNFDFPGIGVWDSVPSLVLCQPTGGQRYGFVTARGTDAAVVTVFNEAGLVLTTHTRFHRDVSFRGAAIVDLMHDLVRRAESIDDALAIARERPVASTWGICVSSWRERTAAVLEINAARVEKVTPAAGASFLACCNRYRHPAMLAGEIASSQGWRLQSDLRERRLRERIEALRAEGGADTVALARLLADKHQHGDERGPARHAGGVLSQSCTVHSVVLEPERRVLSLGVGPAPVSEGPWLQLRWSWDGPVGAWELGGAPAPGVEVAALATGVTRGPATDDMAAALAAQQRGDDDSVVVAALVRAVDAAPDDPSLRLALTWLRMRTGDLGGAADEAAAGLAHERWPYARAQLLLWGARAAAAAGDAIQAETWRRELAMLPGEGVAELQAEARADQRRSARTWRHKKPHANLFMLDAL